MRSTFHAIRDAFRLARGNPGFVAVIVFTLGVGIGATTAAVNVAVRVLVTPPVADESRLLLIRRTLPSGSSMVPFSPAELAAWGEASRTLQSVAGILYDGAFSMAAQIGDRAFTVTGTTASGNFFSVLGTHPLVGQLFSAADALAGSEEVAVIGHDLWQREFAGNPATVGLKLRLNGRLTTIVGVVPREFAFPKGADVWQPLVTKPEKVNEGWFSLIGRLKPEATTGQAADEATRLLDQLRPVAWSTLPNLRTTVIQFKEAVVGEVRPMMRLFVAAAVLLFLVGCINVINLLLVRGTTREKEISLCLALGASPGRLIRQLLREATVFAVAGGALGALVAFWLQRALIAVAPAGLTRPGQIAFDVRTLALVGAGSLLAMLLAGLAPALWTVRRSLFNGFRAAGSTVSGSSRGQVGRQCLVALQLASALLVAVTAALLLRSVEQLQGADLGFAPNRLTVVEVPLVSEAYDDPNRRLDLFDALVSRLEALPEVAAATAVLQRPFIAAWHAAVTREGQTQDEASGNPGVHLEAVLPNYFAAMGVPLARGRPFSDSDQKGSLPVAIISKSLERFVWPGATAVGKRIKFGNPDSPVPWMTVVGVVGDLRYRDLDAPPPAIYVPLRQSQFPPRFVIVRARIDDAPVLALTRRAVKEIDVGEPVTTALPVVSLLDEELASPRFQMFALTFFAAVAVLLAGVGVFGVLAAFVAQRAREVGLRVALGATARDVRRFVLSTLGWPAVLGLSAGTFAAWALAPLLRPLLFDVSALDPRAFAVAWTVLAVTMVVAAAIPLRRAVRVDPVALLRAD